MPWERDAVRTELEKTTAAGRAACRDGKFIVNRRGLEIRLVSTSLLISTDIQHQGEADLFPGKGGELRSSLWKET